MNDQHRALAMLRDCGCDAPQEYVAEAGAPACLVSAITVSTASGGGGDAANAHERHLLQRLPDGQDDRLATGAGLVCGIGNGRLGSPSRRAALLPLECDIRRMLKLEAVR
jgi:hypothetical protein